MWSVRAYMNVMQMIELTDTFAKLCRSPTQKAKQTPVLLNIFKKHKDILTFCIIPQQWRVTGSSAHSVGKRNRLSWLINNMVAGDLATQESRASSVTVMTQSSPDFSAKMVNSSPPNAAYMRQQTGSALVQVMACRLFGAKPLPERMLTYCQLDSWEQTSVKMSSKQNTFHSQKCIWK